MGIHLMTISDAPYDLPISADYDNGLQSTVLKTGAFTGEDTDLGVKFTFLDGRVSNLYFQLSALSIFQSTPVTELMMDRVYLLSIALMRRFNNGELPSSFVLEHRIFSTDGADG
jgi:hypothetical protein